MLKREMKTNSKSFIIWTSILIGIFLIVFLVYPSIINSENAKMIDDMLKVFPDEILKAFNMDISSMDTAFGWFKTEGFIFMLLITGVYSAIMGSTILLKEEDDKTIEYLNCLPIKRISIVINKIVCGMIYIFLMVFIIGLFNYIGLVLSGSFDRKLYVLLSLIPIFSSVIIFSLCLFLSIFTRKTKKMLGMSLGVVFFSYFLQLISGLSKNVEFLKYFSIFTLSDVRGVIINGSINPAMIVIAVLLFAFLTILIIICYNNKEFL